MAPAPTIRAALRCKPLNLILRVPSKSRNRPHAKPANEYATSNQELMSMTETIPVFNYPKI